MRLHTLWASVFLLLIHVPRASSQAVALTYDLPEAPVASQQSAPAAQPGTASVSGVALDSTGAPIPAAKIILSARGRFDERTTTSGRDGTYSFTALPPEAYRITIAAPGFDTLTSTEFNVRAGDSVTAPKTRLSVSATTASVDVTASPAQIAQAQVQEQERQRVFGVFQNFYTSYIWKPAPLPTPLKYKLAARTIFDPTTIAVTAGVAGAEQYENTYPGYGPGIAGYGKRFGAAYGDALTARIIGSAVLPSLLHQDPRVLLPGIGWLHRARRPCNRLHLHHSGRRRAHRAELLASGRQPCLRRDRQPISPCRQPRSRLHLPDLWHQHRRQCRGESLPRVRFASP